MAEGKDESYSSTELIQELKERFHENLPKPPPPPRHSTTPRTHSDTASTEAMALKQRLRTTQRQLKTTLRDNRELKRQVNKLQERLDTANRLQTLLAQRQIDELHQDQHTTSGHVAVAVPEDHGSATNSQHSHVERLTSLRGSLSKKFDAQQTASSMFQCSAITLRELQAVQASHRQPVRAAERLIDVVIRQPYDVYECFLETLKKTRMDLFTWIVSSGIQNETSTTECGMLLRSHYVYLLETLDSKHSGLLDHLFANSVLSVREKLDFANELSSYRQNELLLSAMFYKSEEQFAEFLNALDATDQRHVRDTIKPRTEEEQLEEASAEDEDDFPEVPDPVEVVHLRDEVNRLSRQVDQLKLERDSMILVPPEPSSPLPEPPSPAALLPPALPPPLPPRPRIPAPAAQDMSKSANCVQHTHAETVTEPQQNGRLRLDAQAVGQIKCRDAVSGVAELAGILYIVCQESQSIRTYSADQTRERYGDIVVAGLSNPTDIVACSDTQRLYIAEQQAVFVLPVFAPEQAEMRSENAATSLSVRDGRLLITSSERKRLVLYSAHGQKLRSIPLPGNVTPQHAAQTSRKTFVVCSSGRGTKTDAYKLMEVSDTGEKLQSVSSSSEWTVDWPWYVVISRSHSGHCLVADRNSRVVHLDMTGGDHRVVIDSPQGGEPRRLCLVEDRLIVACSHYVHVFRLT